MRIQIRCECGSECKEWAILELQGSLELQNPEQELRNLEIGSLCRSSSSEEKYTFTVGYHELEGRKVVLKKPLLVLKKTREDKMETDEPTPEEDSQGGKSGFEVAGVVRYKILFKTRPKALISKPEVKARKPRS